MAHSLLLAVNCMNQAKTLKSNIILRRIPRKGKLKLPYDRAGCYGRSKKNAWHLALLLKFLQTLPDDNLLSTSSAMLLRNLQFDLQSV